jgi:hypothetical protein
MNMVDSPQTKPVSQRERSRKKFLRYFPEGFSDPMYLEHERDNQWKAHELFQLLLNKKEFERLLSEEDYLTIAGNSVAVEKEAGLLYPAEKTALIDTVQSKDHAKTFATGLYNYVHSKLNVRERFEQFTDSLKALTKKNTKLFSWPMQTVFAFLADPAHYIFLRPDVTQKAAIAYGFDFFYEPSPNWNTYESAYSFANQISEDNQDLKPRDFIDLQSFIRVIGSKEYK